MTFVLLIVLLTPDPRTNASLSFFEAKNWKQNEAKNIFIFSLPEAIRMQRGSCCAAKRNLEAKPLRALDLEVKPRRIQDLEAKPAAHPRFGSETAPTHPRFGALRFQLFLMEILTCPTEQQHPGVHALLKSLNK